MLTDGGTPAVVPPMSIDSRIVSPPGGITWDSTGAKTVRVMATNESGTVTGTHTILITDTMPTAVAPETVTVDGPASGQIGLSYTFTVTVDPENVTLPISYEVQYTDGTAALGPFSLDQRIINTPDVTWASAGTKTVWITATNEQGFAVGAHEIVIGEEPVDGVTVFLPLVLSNYSPTFAVGSDASESCRSSEVSFTG